MCSQSRPSVQADKPEAPWIALYSGRLAHLLFTSHLASSSNSMTIQNLHKAALSGHTPALPAAFDAACCPIDLYGPSSFKQSLTQS